MENRVEYLDGTQFKKSIIASAQRISEMENHLNAINVFPVPDGDTGTNMVATMDSIVEGAERCDDYSFEEVSKTIADSAFVGAMGNSGVILAQFFQGLAEATKGRIHLTTQSFAAAAIKAVEQARESISTPREGTIITVMKDWANHLGEYAHQTQDFIELLKEALRKANVSLADTPNKLQVLKKAGVVDAGAQGFVNLLEGMVGFIESGKVTALKISTNMARRIKMIGTGRSRADITFRFCTECLIVGDDIDRDTLRDRLVPLGDSLIVVGSRKKARLHIHTNEPERVFEIACACGSLTKKKIEDMYKQCNDMLAVQNQQRIALVADSTCDLPPEILKKYNIHVVPLTLRIGEESYLDRIELKTEEFYHVMQTAREKLSTSQPSLASFKKVYDKLIGIYDSIISIHISGKLSGTIQGARAVRERVNYQDNIRIIDSKTSSAAMGLIAAEAGRLIKEGLDVEEIVDRLKRAVGNTRIFVNLPTLKYAIRSGRVSKTKGFLGTLLNLKPVLTTNSDGSVAEVAKVIGRRKVIRKTLDLAVQFGRKYENPRFSVVHVLAPQLAEWYRNEIRAKFDVEDIMIMDASPALGLHVGIGSTAIAVLGDS